MDFRRLDLNLLIVLDALLDERSVTLTARRLKVSQPTVSFLLKKLRASLGDELFIVTASGMEPTPRAMQMKEAVRSILTSIDEHVLATRGFSPQDLDGPITFSTSDVGELVILPSILPRLRVEAPGALVTSVSMPPERLALALENGSVDLAIGYFPDLDGNVFQQGLFEHPFACLVRADHPTIGDSLSLQQFLEAEHAVVNAEGRSQEIFEREIDRLGISRRIALATPHFMTAPLLIASSDLIMTVPKAVGSVWTSRANLKMLEPPLTVPTIGLKQFWHRRFNKDPRSIWLRSVVTELFQGRDPSQDPDFAR